MAYGFEDTSYFARTFKQMFDTTSTQFSPSHYSIKKKKKTVLRSRIVKILKIRYIIFFCIGKILITSLKNSSIILIFDLIFLTISRKF